MKAFLFMIHECLSSIRMAENLLSALGAVRSSRHRSSDSSTGLLRALDGSAVTTPSALIIVPSIIAPRN